MNQSERGSKIAALQSAITRGLESGSAGELDMEAIKREARQQAGLKAHRAPPPLSVGTQGRYLPNFSRK